MCVRNAVSRRLEGPFYERSLQQGLERARNGVEHAMELAEEAGIDDGEILEGDPADEIVGLADNRGSDLIVVGSRGYVAKQKPTGDRQVA